MYRQGRFQPGRPLLPLKGETNPHLSKWCQCCHAHGHARMHLSGQHHYNCSSACSRGLRLRRFYVLVMHGMLDHACVQSCGVCKEALQRLDAISKEVSIFRGRVGSILTLPCQSGMQMHRKTKRSVKGSMHLHARM